MFECDRVILRCFSTLGRVGGGGVVVRVYWVTRGYVSVPSGGLGCEP